MYAAQRSFKSSYNIRFALLRKVFFHQSDVIGVCRFHLK